MTDNRYETAGEFWLWVKGLRADEDSRGDFICDTRDLLERGRNPDDRIGGAGPEALEVWRKLSAEWRKPAWPEETL